MKMSVNITNIHREAQQLISSLIFLMLAIWRYNIINSAKIIIKTKGKKSLNVTDLHNSSTCLWSALAWFHQSQGSVLGRCQILWQHWPSCLGLVGQGSSPWRTYQADSWWGDFRLRTEYTSLDVRHSSACTGWKRRKKITIMFCWLSCRSLGRGVNSDRSKVFIGLNFLKEMNGGQRSIMYYLRWSN